MKNVNKLVWDNLIALKNKKINIKIFVGVNVSPLAYILQEYLIAHITINLLKHVIDVGGPLLFTFILFGATPLLFMLLLLPPAFSPSLFDGGFWEVAEPISRVICINVMMRFYVEKKVLASVNFVYTTLKRSVHYTIGGTPSTCTK